MAYRSIPVLGIAFLGNSSLIARKLKILISTRRILVLVVVFSFQILLEKVLKKWQLLVESWFWLLFFLFKFYLKKCWKMKISKLLVQSWFWCCLFPKNNINRATVNSTNRWHTAAYLFLALLFSGNSSLIARKLKILISTRRILVLVVVFSFQILLEKVLKNGSFWSNLGFGCVFSCSNSTWKSVEKLDFAAFGRSWFWLWLLLLLLLLFFSKFYLKKCWNMNISKHLVDSGFWLLLFFSKSIWRSVEK